MKLTFSHLLFLLLLFCNVGLIGQNTPACTYKLECADLGLDGWNDASLEIIVGNKVNRFTLQTGSKETFYLQVYKNQNTLLFWLPHLTNQRELPSSVLSLPPSLPPSLLSAWPLPSCRPCT